jgi:hypothetical protein
MRRRGALSLAVVPRNPDVSMDCRVKPGNDEQTLPGLASLMQLKTLMPCVKTGMTNEGLVIARGGFGDAAAASATLARMRNDNGQRR